MLNTSGINDLQLGSLISQTHPIAWSQYYYDNAATPNTNPAGFDPNEPYVMKDRGILFKGERYLTSIPQGTYKQTWMLEHPHYFSIEAWVRKDLDSFFDPMMNETIGQIFHKVSTTGMIMYGLSMSNT